MRIVSLQVGQPRTVGHPGAGDPMERAFTSAIWKAPVAGPVRVGSLGLEGDAVADRRNHGGPDQAILMYAASHYRSWRGEWGQPELGPGDFGENLTVDGPTETSVCLGDVFGLGEVRLEVSHPRQPCATLARRHQRRDLVATVLTNGRSGWYARVVSGGEVVAGMPIALLDRPHPAWTVRRAALAMARRHQDPAEAARLVSEVPALSNRWRARLSRPGLS